MSDPVGKKPVTIAVPSKDPPEKKKDKDKDQDGGRDNGGLPGATGSGSKSTKEKAKGKGKVAKDEPEELSEEDKALKEGLELAVMRADDPEPGIGEN